MLIAIADKRITKKDWYDYEEGAQFVVLNKRIMLSLVEDNLGFQHWLPNAYLTFHEVQNDKLGLYGNTIR